MKIYYVSDEYDTMGFGVVRCYGYKEIIQAISIIKQLQVEHVLKQEINKEGYSLTFPINDRNYFYNYIKPDFEKLAG